MNELAAALADVRKSYRLIWAYQRRIMDAVQFAVDQFPMLRFYAWKPQHTQRPAQLTTNPIKGKWAWDGLPFYKVSFLYLLEGADPQKVQKGDWMLEIHVDTDSVDFRAGRGEPDAKGFQDADHTHSLLTFYVWECSEPFDANWFYNVWQGREWPGVDGSPLTQKHQPVRVLRMRHDLALLADKEAMLAAVQGLKEVMRRELSIDV